MNIQSVMYYCILTYVNVTFLVHIKYPM